MNTRLLKIVVASVALFGAVYYVGLGELTSVFKKLSYESIFFLLLISVVLIYISALKWSLFLKAFGSSETVFRLFNLYLLGYFVNLLVPSYIGGDLARSWRLGKKVGQKEALTATILERYTGLVAMIVLALLFIWFVEYSTYEMKLAVVGISIAVAAVTYIAISSRLLNHLSKISGLEPIIQKLKKIQEGILFAWRDKRLLSKTFGLSFLFHSLTILNTAVAGWAVGWENPPIADLFVVVPVVLLISAIPISPSGLGIQEGAFLFFLKGLGATSAEALGVGLVLRAKTYFLALLGGVVLLMENRRKVASFNNDG